MRKGFTLIELILYFTMTGIFFFAATTFALEILKLNTISGNYHEIQSNADSISQKIMTTIQKADSINAAGSVFDNDQGVLSLNMQNPNESPTTFMLTNGNIVFTEGLNSAIQLNSENVQFTSLRFHRINYPKAPDQIVIDAAIETNTIDTKVQRDFNIHLSISLRNI